MFPKRIEIDTWNLALKRLVEWLGYWPESMTPQKAIMRHDLPGAFQGVYPRPEIDRASLESVRIL